MDTREDGRAADGHHAIIKILASASRKSCSTQVISIAGEIFRREAAAALGLAADAGKFLYIVVPGRDVRVTDRPIDGDSLFQVGFKVEIAPAIALASPGDGFSADWRPRIQANFLPGSEE